MQRIFPAGLHDMLWADEVLSPVCPCSNVLHMPAAGAHGARLPKRAPRSGTRVPALWPQGVPCRRGRLHQVHVPLFVYPRQARLAAALQDGQRL